MNSSSPRKKEYPSLSYQKSPNAGHRSDRISIGNLNENLVGGEKKRHIKDHRNTKGNSRINGVSGEYNERRHQSRRNKEADYENDDDDDDDDDEYDEEFRRMSIGSPIPNSLVNPDGSPRKQVKGHYPSIKVDQVKDARGNYRDRYNKKQKDRREDNYDDEDSDDEQKDREVPKSPASPLISPRGRNGDQVAERPRRMPPPASPRLLRSRSPNNLSPRTPSPTPMKSAGKEYIAYYEEDVDLRPKSTSPRDKNQQDHIPSLGNRGNAQSETSYKKRSPRSPRDGDGNFDWNDYISPRSKHESSYDEYNEETHQQSKYSPRENQGGSSRRRERGRSSAESPPLSPLSSSGGSSIRSPRESPRSPDDVRSSWESPRSDHYSSSEDRSPRDDYFKPVPAVRRKKPAPAGGKLEPIDYR